MLGLTWDCVDFEKNTILVNKQLQKTQKVGGEYALVPTKNSRSRTITVAPSVMEMLKLQRDKQMFQQRRAGVVWGNEWNLVFTDEMGKYLPHFTVYKTFKAVVTRMGMPEERLQGFLWRRRKDLKCPQGRVIQCLQVPQSVENADFLRI